MEATAKLNKVCREVGVCPNGTAAVIKTPGVKYARIMQKEGQKVLAFLWEDDSISSCAFDHGVQCCHTEIDGGSEAYWAWIAHLASKGYKETPIEVS